MSTLEAPPAPAEPHRGGGGPTASADGDGRSRRLWALVGLALALLGAGMIVVSTSFDEPVAANALGPNLPVNEGARVAADISAVNSPTVVRNPVAAGNLAVAGRVDSPRFSCSLHVTFDGGGNWIATPIPAPRGEEPKCYAPDAAFAADGTLFVSYVTLEGRANSPNAVWLASSRDGGRTLSGPRRLLGPLAFQVRLVADPKAAGRLHVTYLQGGELGLYRFTEPGNPIMSISSEDAGRTWSAPQRVSDARRRRVLAPSPAVGPRGELYVLHLDLGEDALDYHGAHEGRGGPPYGGRWQLVLARRTDDDRWTESVVEDALVPTERFIPFTPPFPSLAVDQRTGRVYAAFHDGRLGDADAWLWTLGPAASDWEGPRRINDTPQRDGTAQYLPKLAVAPDGRLDAVYYDRRGDRTNVLNEVSLQFSLDEGDSFSRRVRLSDRPFSSRIGYGAERGMPDLGSRLGLVSTDRAALAVWSDTRAGTRVTAKQDLARGVAAFSDPPRLSDTLETILRIGGILIAGVGAGALLAALLPGRRRVGPAGA